ncbi:hypothetical protein [Streptomyces rimosus]|uniref:hypothetical protein n=1 Tax=Streptomyces rimosus TaxID=1927 RepID=UPI0004C23669|nr:hypothetical protein [Streptomyces rimosus]
MFGIENYTPHWLSGIADIRAAHAQSLRALIGRPLTRLWLVWDTQDDEWFSDCPVLLDFDGEQVEVNHYKIHDLSITWNSVDPRVPLQWPAFPTQWRHDAAPQTTALLGQPLQDIEFLDWQGADMAQGMVAVSFLFPSGRITIYNALDENGLTFAEPGPEYRRHTLATSA